MSPHDTNICKACLSNRHFVTKLPQSQAPIDCSTLRNLTRGPQKVTHQASQANPPDGSCPLFIDWNLCTISAKVWNFQGPLQLHNDQPPEHLYFPYNHDDVIKWKHFPRYWPFVRGIHRSPVNSPHKGQWRGALMFTFICARINGWVNNREAGDLRRNRAHSDVIVMWHDTHETVISL